MLLLNKDEEIVLVVHKHWFVMVRVIVLFAILLLIPPIVVTFLPTLTEGFDPTVIEPAINFFLALYVMVLLLFLFLTWMDHHLDMWVITNFRIIDVEQNGLFNREISEVPLDRVQDVTIDVKGLVETFLKFGTIRIQTAGEREFAIHDIPRLYEVKDVILRYAQGKNISGSLRAKL